MIIGYQGIPGCYSESALDTMVKLENDYEKKNFNSFEKVFKAVYKQEINLAFLPIENNLGGSIYLNYDLLVKYGLNIIGEYNFLVNHYLICHPDSNINNIKKVISHPQALSQCDQYISKNDFEREDFYDTSGAVKHILDNNLMDVAAIASINSAKLYNMKILVHKIQDCELNYTRFFLLCKDIYQNHLRLENNKISIYFILKNNTGSLVDSLQILSKYNIDLTKIECRPYPWKNKLINKNDIFNPFRYIFYIDMKKTTNDQNIYLAFEELKQKTIEFKIIGHYPSIF